MPVHVVFLELIIDPACSIVFEAEPEEPDVMSRPPRSRKEPLFSRRTVFLSLTQGFAVLAVTLFIYWFAMNRGQSDLEARSLTFVTLVFANLGLILSNRFWSKNVLSSLRYKNTALYVIVIGAMVLLNLVIFVPFLRDLFSFGTMHVSDLLICFTAGIACILWFEVVKYFSRPKAKPIKA
jgi:Ca2+-transporting ATPase